MYIVMCRSSGGKKIMCFVILDNVCVHSGHDTTGLLSQKQAEYFFARQVCVVISTQVDIDFLNEIELW